jgi:hypothetical protein
MMRPRLIAVPDERGVQLIEQRIEAGLPLLAARFTPLPVDAMAAALARKGHEVQGSSDAGRFLCNYLYCRSLAAAAAANNAANNVASIGGARHLALFTHVPPFDAIPLEGHLAFGADLVREVLAQLRLPPSPAASPVARALAAPDTLLFVPQQHYLRGSDIGDGEVAAEHSGGQTAQSSFSSSASKSGLVGVVTPV